MAKGSAMGLWRGKKGSSVFFKIKNSSNGQKQGIRERVYEVSNPKSSSQAGQRMKMLPAQRFLGALSSVITRGFEGVEYGQASRQKFMQYALKMSTGYPAVEKDSNKVWPGEYLISRGQLPEVGVTIDTAGTLAISTLTISGEPADSSVGEFSKCLLEGNSWLNEGDQITIVTCEADDAGGLLDAVPIYKVNSFMLDKTGITQIPHVTVTAGAFGVTPSLEGFIAAAVIVSREGNNGQHLRSNAIMTINKAYAEELFSSERYAAARKSYMNTATSAADTDWPVEPDFANEVFNSTMTLTGLTGNFSSLNGRLIKVIREVDTNAIVGYYYKAPMSGTNALITPDGTPLSVTVDMAVTYLTASSVPALANARPVLFTEGA